MTMDFMTAHSIIQSTSRKSSGGTTEDVNREFLLGMLAVFAAVMTPLVLMILWTLVFPPEWKKFDTVKQETVQVQLAGVHPPKHFHVDLRDPKLGVTHRYIYVSKHFNNWRSLTLGKTITVYRTTKKHRETGEVKYEFDSSALQAALEYPEP